MNTLSESSDNERLEVLLCEKCNGTLGPDGFAELHALLAKSADLRSAYWAMNAIHADLEWDIVSKQSVDSEVVNLLAAEFADVPARMSGRRSSPVEFARRWGWGPALAAGLAAILLSGGMLAYLSSGKQFALLDERPAIAARLSALAADSRWSLGRPGHWNPEAISFGDTIWVEQGRVEMRMGDTVGQLLAPAALELLTENRVRLLSGKIMVNAPARENGFTVETPSAEVVDLGTIFSVEAAETGTDLIVYGGKVDLKVPNRDAGTNEESVTSKQFVAGQAVRVDRNGTLSRIMNVQSSAGSLAPGGPAAAPVITSVVDNIVRDDLWAFYEVVQGGMAEDAYCFVDRVHEWNGKTEAGMPSYLLGAEYVKTFNDDKITEGLSIAVTLSRPATLYVLFDKRLPPPAWLTESFVDTGDEMGVDESGDTGHFFPDHPDWAQIGPGKSINRVHSIWKQVVPAGGTVRLGPNGQLPTDEKRRNLKSHANMYGLVAVPLEQPEKSEL